MNLPVFWRQAAFSVAESADLLRVPEFTLRTWMARCHMNDFLGAKTSGRIFFSAHDLFFWSLIRDLAGFGVGLRVAMYSMENIADAARYGLPSDERLVVRKEGPEVWNFELVDDPDIAAATALVIPLRAVAIDLIERAAVVYLKEGS